jgi:hypothetical protein
MSVRCMSSDGVKGTRRVETATGDRGGSLPQVMSFDASNGDCNWCGKAGNWSPGPYEVADGIEGAGIKSNQSSSSTESSSLDSCDEGTCALGFLPHAICPDCDASTATTPWGSAVGDVGKSSIHSSGESESSVTTSMCSGRVCLQNAEASGAPEIIVVISICSRSSVLCSPSSRCCGRCWSSSQ